METNYYNEDEETRMMGEEYGKDLGGCLWGFVICAACAALIGILVFFT